MSANGWQKYTELSCIGSGAFGSVYLVEGNPARGGPSGRFVVKKVHVATLNQKELKDAVNEVFILRMLDHPNIINYLDHFVCPEGYLNIVMEYCPGGDLNHLILEQRKGGADHYFPEDQVRYMSFQLLQALKYVHGIKILHRDLKPGNVLLGSQGRIKVCDFGISKRLAETVHAVTVVGTPFYLAPEICESKPYGSAGDIWAAGCVIYELAALRRAFDASNLLAVVRRITSGEYLPLPPHFSDNFREMVDRMLTPDPNLRPTVEQIIDEFFVLPIPSHVVEEVVEAEDPPSEPEAEPTPDEVEERECYVRPTAPPPRQDSSDPPVSSTPKNKSAFPSRSRDINVAYNKWNARLHRMAGQQRHELERASHPPPATAAQARSKALLHHHGSNVKPSTPVGPPVVRQVHRPRPASPSNSRGSHSGPPGSLTKTKPRGKKGFTPEIEFCLMPHQRNLFLRKQEFEPLPKPEAPAAEPIATQLEERQPVTPETPVEEIAEDVHPEVDNDGEEDYEYVFEPYAGQDAPNSGSSPDTHERPFRASIRSKELATAALCKSIDDETAQLALDFRKRFAESLELAAQGDRSDIDDDVDDGES
eukprot:GGOE01036729.1.p1 GENE.GGOE01036729.1~~GGOE01036729.1.p1  ORF type:complete len:616 (+),score=194.92 GGOE01036729.1:73-1848(+)